MRGALVVLGSWWGLGARQEEISPEYLQPDGEDGGEAVTAG